jgi:hypothetical protein
MWEIAGDRKQRTFATMAEAKAAMQSDREQAVERQWERWRREQELQNRWSDERERQRREDERARIEALLTEVRSGPGQAEAAMHQAIAEGRLEDALAAALRLIALPAVLEVAETMLAGQEAARPASADAEPTLS